MDAEWADREIRPFFLHSFFSVMSMWAFHYGIAYLCSRVAGLLHIVGVGLGEFYYWFAKGRG